MKTVESDEPPATEERTTLRVDADLLAVLDHYIAEHAPGATREDALRAVLREWAGRHGYLPLHQQGVRPEDLNASNDD